LAEKAELEKKKADLLVGAYTYVVSLDHLQANFPSKLMGLLAGFGQYYLHYLSL
jgi:hypothetical protein